MHNTVALIIPYNKLVLYTYSPARNKRSGFTLIELLVVITIIGLLSSVVLASLNTARAKGRDARRIADLKQMRIALDLYYDTNGSYPGNASAVPATALAALVTGGFISVIPSDPGSNAYLYSGVASNGSTLCTSACPLFVLKASLETNNSVLAADIDTAFAAPVNTCADGTGPYQYCVMP